MISLNTNIVLDEAAEKIYRMLGGLDTRNRVEANTGPPDNPRAGLIGSLMEQEHQLDLWRRSLVELGILVGTFLHGARSSKQSSAPVPEIDMIVDYLTASLSQIPDSDGSVLIRFRGRHRPGATAAEALDYVLQAGHVVVDMNKTLQLRQGPDAQLSHLPDRLRKAFEVFDRLAINNIRLDIGRRGPEELERLHLSLQLLYGFFSTAAPTFANSGKETAPESSGLGIYNEYQRLDPNLTLLAGINRLKSETVQEMVARVAEMMCRPDAPAELGRYASVYDAVFAFKKIREQLAKPMVEVNSIRWLLASRGQESITPGMVQLARTVARLLADTPKKIGQVMESIYGSDYRDILATDLQGNMDTVGKFLNTLQGREIDPQVRREVLDNVKQGLERTPDELLEGLAVADGRMTARTNSGKTVSKPVHAELLDMVSFFQKRVGTKKKLRQMLYGPVDFEAQDLKVLARDFGIDRQEAGALISLLRECFTDIGHFDRRAFERNIPVFLKYERKIFDFLWHYLKEIKFRVDRVSFLNSLQLLIAQMSQPQLALDVLLQDFVHAPHRVSFSDRNGLILANILLRKYNKELNNFIENTPEEVLLVRKGLDREMTASAAKLIGQDYDRYLQKVRTLHNKLLEAIKTPKEAGRTMPLRYLFTVEREIFILLSLVGETAAHKIMQSVVAEYGNPQAYIYSLISNQDQMKAVFQLLQLTVRGLLRFNDKKDLPLLEKINGQAWMFVDLNPELLTKEMVSRVMEYVEHGITRLSSR